MDVMGITPVRPRYRAVLILLAIVPLAGCGALAPLVSLIQPPHFERAGDRPAELRFMSPSAHPLGGAGVTLWLDVTNPNPFGFTLSTLHATLLLEGTRAATGDFQLGLPLGAGQTTAVPLDLAIGFADVPGLASALQQAATGRAVASQVEGTVGVDAGRHGGPIFGPMMLARGELGVTAAP